MTDANLTFIFLREVFETVYSYHYVAIFVFLIPNFR